MQSAQHSPRIERIELATLHVPFHAAVLAGIRILRTVVAGRSVSGGDPGGTAS